MIRYDTIYLLTAIGLSPGGSSTVQYSTHIHTEEYNLQLWLEGFLGFEPRMVKLKLTWEECGPCPVFASRTL